MTDRKARKLIYAVIEANKNRFNDDTLEALEMGRTALEQPTVDVLEQIRGEIKHLLNRPSLTHVLGYDKGFVDAIDNVLRIIDKYKAESRGEDKE